MQRLINLAAAYCSRATIVLFLLSALAGSGIVLELNSIDGHPAPISASAAP